LKKNKKYRPGRKCVIDAGTICEEPAVIRKGPFTSNGDTFVVVVIMSEVMNSKEECVPKATEVRLPIERISL